MTKHETVPILADFLYRNVQLSNIYANAQKLGLYKHGHRMHAIPPNCKLKLLNHLGLLQS